MCNTCSDSGRGLREPVAVRLRGGGRVAMRSHRLSFVLGIAACLALVPLASVGAAPLKEPEIDGAVQVTPDPGNGRGHAIPVLAVHPDDPATLVLAETDAYTSRCMVHVSRNGGLSWAR